MRPLFDKMKYFIVEGIKLTCSRVITTYITWLIIYLIGITLIVFFVWQPFLNYLHRSDIQTKKILAIPPLEITVKIRNVLQYIEKSTLPDNNSS